MNGPPSTPLLLEKPTPKLHNILVGDDPAQIRFAESYISHAYFCKDECEDQNHFKLKCVETELVLDEMLLGHDEPLLFRVERVREIELSERVKKNVGIWSLAPITRGSDGANAIVRSAAEILGLDRPNHASVEKFGEAMVRMMAELSIRKEVEDVTAAVWAAAWLLTGPEPEPIKFWPRPWENHLTWFPRGTNPGMRLNTLYRELVVWVFARDGDEAAARKVGKFKPKEFQKLKNLRLPVQCVIDSIVELSLWRLHKSDPYVSALKLAKIWQTQ